METTQGVEYMKKQLFCAGLCLALTLSMGTQAFAE